MNFLAITYQNIWPFYNQTITLDFKNWKYLVNAPIWKWKSFLFFDGPIFALYKYSSRNMLNRKSQKWYVRLLFEAGGKILLIERLIKPTKSWWESTQSRLWEIQEDKINLWLENIINNNIDIKNLLKNYKIEELVFKSNLDLQNVLNSFIKPREVLLSTSFLMQDSENIFDLTPVERINVFKDIFNLLDIDSNKTILSEKRRETQLKLKIQKDTWKYNDKLKINISEMMSILEKIKKNQNYKKDWINQILEEFNNIAFWNDIKLIWDKLNLDNLDISEIKYDLLENVLGKIDILKQDHQKLANQKENLESEFTKNNQKINLFNSKINDKKLKIKTIENNLINLEKTDKKKIKEQKEILLKKQTSIYQNINTDILINNWYKHQDIWELNDVIEKLINQWNEYKSSTKNIDLQIDNLNEKEKDIQRQIINIWKQIENFDISINKQKTFFCEKINSNCPYLDIIKSSSIKSIELNKNELNIQINNLKEKLINLNASQKLKEFEKQKDDIKFKTDKLKEIFKIFNRKQFKQEFENYRELDNQIRKIDQEIYGIEKEEEKIQSYKNELISLKSKIDELSSRILETQKEQEKLNQEIEKTKINEKNINLNELNNFEKLIINLKDKINKIQELINDFKQNQLEIKKLKDDEKIYSDLYNIFSKELMLIVLRDFLPSLEDIINNLLLQVVGYTIKFDLPEKEKIELDIQIIDEKWTRWVKSLSWWQRTILKLVWILSVSSMIKSDFLFLDETINNLDFNTVWKVWDMLEDFIRKNELKLYIVTHSKQIQQMNIWDQIVELD